MTISMNDVRSSNEDSALDPAFSSDWQDRKRFRANRALRNRHRFVFILSLVVVGLALSLRVVDGDRIAFKGWEEYPLPHVCMSRVLLDMNCPACGLTRATVHSMHGRWQDAQTVHPSGVIVALFILFQIPYRAMGFLGTNPRPIGPTAPVAIGISVGVVTVVLWCASIFLN